MLVICLDNVPEGTLSYEEVKELSKEQKYNDFIVTNNLTWFQMWYLEDFGDIMLYRKKTDEYISLKEMLDTNGEGYSEKYIHEAHNVLKIFIAGGFNFKENGATYMALTERNLRRKNDKRKNS